MTETTEPCEEPVTIPTALLNAATTDPEKLKKKKRKCRKRKKNINVRTLFVGGLPMDTRPREIYLMFRKFNGYQGSILKVQGKEGKTASPVAFVTFENRLQAEVAKSELHGVRFDETVPRTLKIEFARSNTKDAASAISKSTPIVNNKDMVIQPPTVPLKSTGMNAVSPVMSHPNDVTMTAAAPWLGNVMCTDMNGNFIHAPFQSIPMPPPALPQPALPTPAALQPAPPPPGALTVVQPPPPPPPNPTFIPNPDLVINTNGTPCTTLFVANLGHNANEDEIKELFHRIPSFRRLKMHRNKGTKPVVFVQYDNITAAVQAKSLFGGTPLFSSESGGIRIEYAKKDMGELLTSTPSTFTTSA